MDLSWLDPSIAELKKTAGNDQYKAKNYGEALKLYSEAIDLCPDNAIYYGNRSACLMMMGDYKEALNDSQHAVSIDHKFSKGYERIIKCCLALGDIIGAKEAIKKLTSIGSMKDAYPSNPCTLFTRGLYLYHKTDVDLDECLKHFKQAFTLDSDFDKERSIWQQVNRLKEMRETGNKLFKEGHFRKAHEKYTEALQINPLSEDIKSKILFNRALMSSKLGKIRDAIADCSSSLRINRTYLKAILLRAKCHSDLFNYKDCIKDYKAALKINRTFDIEIALSKAKIAFNTSKMSRKRPEKKNYYQILGIERGASAKVIRQAYKKLALIHHPDRHSNATENVKRDHERIFKEIGQAYEVLSDFQKKAQYDSRRRRT
ncbi:dnaJ homolog subfamily C member 7-like [Sitodiplosis mosellana]|uniref:dnaJ homolog subfamily C member 7-like n=1 Tax=Sitodiplosis mosellana TaxID=263140 RepID=UPI002444E58E|nr:dnaJ homolog subfamily C member 7-like [Sitodiplosis mosellana]